ncbi:uncharacterized protein [Antedon mediterranea]|uniref:uncharacterized protein n=1 Tax=Antedon mediterranea TaxID=105859 RepID=UPI003AF61015
MVLLKLLTIISCLVCYISGQEYKCRYLYGTNCSVVEAYTSREYVGGVMQYDCKPTLPSCSSISECRRILLTFTSSPLEFETTLFITIGLYTLKFNNESQEFHQEYIDISPDENTEYIIEFGCQTNRREHVSVSLYDLQIECVDGECETSKASYVSIPIILIGLVVVAVVLIKRRQKRIKEEAKKQFDRENPDYQSLQKNRGSQKYQLPSMWRNRNKRTASSASDRVYEVCGKVVGQPAKQDKSSSNGDYDYDYAYARTNAARKGFEDSGGYLKPNADDLDEDAYLKPSPSSTKKTTGINGSSVVQKGYLKPSQSNSLSQNDSDDNSSSDYEYVEPDSDVIKHSTNKTSSKDENRKSAGPQNKPVIPKKPAVQVKTSNTIRSAESSPIVKRPQPSPRTRKRESDSTQNDYLSIVEPDLPNQKSIKT